ncbi:probable long-chain-alcohol O-fatty-acyltransferase 1 [Neltuma alba]|uniref:probable long-chain-alcohol O-fatty-acyltransferase 1 n=1 Tax=Neltuma alba TaxID=207710 RepID=UPI0010A58DE3|nr:probable long-chain-alcohol O-fatty-acyltransferase 1 [Prosopis alba]
MEDEIQNFIKVWIKAISCLCYCYFVSSRIPKGFLRLLSLLPIFFIFLLLPLTLTPHSLLHIAGPTIFFLAWLCPFKLLLFSFDEGPLSPLPPNILHFILIASLPIKIDPQGLIKNPEKRRSKPVLFIKVLLLAAIVSAYDYRDNLHPHLILFLYCCHMYLGLELMLGLFAAPARAVFGFQIEPQFNEPYLSTSLQDFWGRRWNLMVTSILRPTVYDPIRRISTLALGLHYGPMPAVLATFIVSGMMHELMYYYLTRVPPTWEVTWFFVLHGVCTAAEVEVKKVAGRRGWRLPRVVSGPLTVAFLAVTGEWLFFPQLKRNSVDGKIIEEYSMMVDFVKSRLR